MRIAVTIVNHAALDIPAAPETVWRAILDDYVGAQKFREQGYRIEPLDDPAGILSGYRMRLEKDGALVDDRIAQFTERDATARRLSLCADYLLTPGGMQVFATYQAHAFAGGTRYTLDCHTRTNIEAPADGAKKDIAAAVAELKERYAAGLVQYLEGFKRGLECKIQP